SIVMALLAGAVGVLLAIWGARVLVALAPADVPRLTETGIDGHVLAFAFGVSVVASLLFGLAPALQVLRIDLNNSLKQGTARATFIRMADIGSIIFHKSSALMDRKRFFPSWPPARLPRWEFLSSLVGTSMTATRMMHPLLRSSTKPWPSPHFPVRTPSATLSI